MARQLQPQDTTNATKLQPAAGAPDAASPELARILSEKLAQGYLIESQTGTEAVLFTLGRKRWYGLRGRDPGTRQRVTIDNQGRAKTRKLDLVPAP